MVYEVYTKLLPSRAGPYRLISAEYNYSKIDQQGILKRIRQPTNPGD